MQNPFVLDLPPDADERFLVAERMKKLTADGWISPICSLCRNPTATIMLYKPDTPGAKFATKTPKGVTRVFFFPVCVLCAHREKVEDELKWKATESLFTNSPTESHGFGLYH